MVDVRRQDRAVSLPSSAATAQHLLHQRPLIKPSKAAPKAMPEAEPRVFIFTTNSLPMQRLVISYGLGVDVEASGFHH
jgi:hypothetical protein